MTISIIKTKLQLSKFKNRYGEGEELKEKSDTIFFLNRVLKEPTYKLKIIIIKQFENYEIQVKSIYTGFKSHSFFFQHKREKLNLFQC